MTEETKIDVNISYSEEITNKMKTIAKRRIKKIIDMQSVRCESVNVHVESVYIAYHIRSPDGYCVLFDNTFFDVYYRLREE